MFDIPLFRDRYSLTKIAMPATVSLPDDDKKWGPQVLSELHRQAPIMQDYHSNIVMDRTDPQKGYGFGYIIATPKTNNPLLADTLPSVKIPVVIRNFRLSPFDVFFDQSGDGFPLTERRLQQALMRMDPFDGPVNENEPGPGSDVRQMLTPPWENVGQFYRGVNSAVSQAGQVKTSSLLSSLSGYIQPKALVKIANWVRSDEGKHLLYNNDARDAFQRSLGLRPMATDNLVKVAEAEGPVVIQYRWNGGDNVMVKFAQPGGFDPQQGQVPAQDAAQQMPPEQQEQLAQDGAAVQAPQMEVMSPEQMDMDEFQPVSTFGVYKVITVNNEQMLGWVFPFLLSFKMEKIPMALFTDGSNYATHQMIPGVLAGTSTALPSETPQGRGFFYVVRNGKAFAFAPIDLMGEQQQPDGSVVYMATTILGGNQIQLQKVQGMNSPAEMGEQMFAIPMDVKWVSFKNQTNPLVEDPMQASQRSASYLMAQQAQAQQAAMAQQQQAQQGGGKQQKTASLMATVRATQDNTYTLGGPAFEELDRKHTHFLDASDTAWMLALAGIDPDYTMSKLASIHIMDKGFLEFPTLRRLTPPRVEHVKIASLSHPIYKLNRFLVKEAAAIQDPMIADTLLSLNFLTPDNISHFIANIPQLEETIHLLSNMLLASRVGAKEIPEGACSDALRNLDDVINGIRLLTMRDVNV